MFKCSNVQILKCSNALIFKCSDVQILKVKCQISLSLNLCRSVALELLRSFLSKWVVMEIDLLNNAYTNRDYLKSKSLDVCNASSFETKQQKRFPWRALFLWLKFRKSSSRRGEIQQMKHGSVKVNGKSFDVKNVMMIVLYICSNLPNTFTFFIDSTHLEIYNCHPTKIPTPFYFSQC